MKSRFIFYWGGSFKEKAGFTEELQYIRKLKQIKLQTATEVLLQQWSKWNWELRVRVGLTAFQSLEDSEDI